MRLKYSTLRNRKYNGSGEGMREKGEEERSFLTGRKFQLCKIYIKKTTTTHECSFNSAITNSMVKSSHSVQHSGLHTGGTLVLVRLNCMHCKGRRKLFMNLYTNGMLLSI